MTSRLSVMQVLAALASFLALRSTPKVVALK